MVDDFINQSSRLFYLSLFVNKLFSIFKFSKLSKRSFLSDFYVYVHGSLTVWYKSKLKSSSLHWHDLLPMYVLFRILSKGGGEVSSKDPFIRPYPLYTPYPKKTNCYQYVLLLQNWTCYFLTYKIETKGSEHVDKTKIFKSI